jgi:hypothetical protein
MSKHHDEHCTEQSWRIIAMPGNDGRPPVVEAIPLDTKSEIQSVSISGPDLDSDSCNDSNEYFDIRLLVRNHFSEEITIDQIVTLPNEVLLTAVKGLLDFLMDATNGYSLV